MIKPSALLVFSCLLFTSAPSYGWGSYGYSGHYGHHGRHGYSGHYGRHGYYGYHYRPHYGYHGSRHYGHGYGHRYGYHGGHHRYGYYGAHGLVHGILSIPGAVVGSLFGYPSYYYRHDYSRSTLSPRDRIYEAPKNGSNGQGDYSNPPSNDPPQPQAPSSGAPDSTTQGGNGSGWRELADGSYSQALSTFADLAEANPNKGIPKVGYALASAAGGDQDRGIWAMRRALRIDPNAIHYVAIDDRLRPRIQDLVSRYQQSMGTGRNADAAFMVASLHYLLGDTSSARSAIDVAVGRADYAASTTNLQRLIAARASDAGADGELSADARRTTMLPR